ncbi:MAG: RNA-binding S4 domain-containing protein [Rhizobiales bacterium]|nr:RNA-binding S4 domain-containing protein [Hyphomicrobiales bacterium]
MRRGGAHHTSHALPGDKPARQRLDLWLWHARFLSRRKDCAALVQEGFVRVNAMRVVHPGHAIKPGDVLTLALPRRTILIVVMAFSDRRGGPEDAARLYRFVDPAP